MDYTFIEINRALEKNWRTFFSTETLAPGGGTGGVGKEGKGVKRITIEFSKNPIINYLALNGTPDLTSSSYSTIELDYEQESDFKRTIGVPFYLILLIFKLIS